MSKQPESSKEGEVEVVEGKTADTVVYQCVTFNVLFDILVNDEMIHGQWGTRDGKRCVEFHVPKKLVGKFERHYHVRCGSVVKA